MNDPLIDRVAFRQFVAERVYVYVSEHLSDYPALRENATWKEMIPHAVEGLVLQLQSWCLSGKIPTNHNHFTVEYPDGPWQAFKYKYAPRWLKTKFPVIMHRENVVSTTNHYFVCPHLVTDPTNMHLKFMATGRSDARYL